MNFIKYWAIVIISLCLIYSCKQNEIFTEQSDAKLSFSIDTLQFDTVFTSIGSTTLSFRFYNPNEKAVKTTISLSGGSNSNFRINVDGFKTHSLTDYEIMGHDSAYVFVEVTVDPQDANSPMLIEDSIMFYTNGNIQNVKLAACGQDVHFFNGETVKSQTWIDDKPYLVYSYLIIDSLETLNIEPGVQVYFHNNSSLVVKGTINAKGTLDKPIVFQGDRLESWFDDVPGQWGHVAIDGAGNPVQLAGIQFFPGSRDNVMDYTHVKNSIIGLSVWNFDDPADDYVLVLSNSVIRTMSYFGIQAYSSRILTYNTVIADCGSHAVFLRQGGLYEFYHSTIANINSSDSRKVASVAFENNYIADNKMVVFPINVLFANSIIEGVGFKENNELIYNLKNVDGLQVDYLFDHCMIRLKDTADISDKDHFRNVIKIGRDSSVNFVDTKLGDYHLDTLSTAKDRGFLDYAKFVTTDFDGVSRLNDLGPDIGAFERIEEGTEEKK